MLARITMTTIGALIRESRLAKGMSMGQLASAVGRTATSVRRWERDEVIPPAEVVSRLVEVLDIDPDEVANPPHEPEEPEVAAMEVVADGTTEAEVEAVIPESAGTTEEAAPELPLGAATASQLASQPTTLSPEVEAEPETERRTVRYYLDHLFDPDRPYLGYVRATLTAVVAIILLWLLIWALGELFESLGRVWDQFGREETETTEAAAMLGRMVIG